MIHTILDAIATLAIGWAAGAVVGLIGWVRSILVGEIF